MYRKQHAGEDLEAIMSLFKSLRQPFSLEEKIPKIADLHALLASLARLVAVMAYLTFGRCWRLAVFVADQLRGPNNASHALRACIESSEELDFGHFILFEDHTTSF